MNIEFSNSFTAHVVGVVDNLLPRLPNVLFDLLVGILIIQVLSWTARLIMRLTNVQTGLRDVIAGVLESIMWLLLVVALMNELGFSGIIYFFTGSVAAIGLAMAAGGSTLVSDIVAGIFLARDTDFNVGDEIEITLPMTSTRGHIESMDSRRTRLRDDEGLLHVIPNSVIERNEWIVHRSRPEISTLMKATKAARRLSAVAREKRRAVASRKNGKTS